MTYKIVQAASPPALANYARTGHPQSRNREEKRSRRAFDLGGCLTLLISLALPTPWVARPSRCLRRAGVQCLRNAGPSRCGPLERNLRPGFIHLQKTRGLHGGSLPRPELRSFPQPSTKRISPLVTNDLY